MKDWRAMQKNIKYTLVKCYPERIHDKDATNFIYIVIIIKLEKAIEDKILCPFDYHTVNVELTDEEKLESCKNLMQRKVNLHLRE